MTRIFTPLPRPAPTVRVGRPRYTWGEAERLLEGSKLLTDRAVEAFMATVAYEALVEQVRSHAVTP